MAVEQNCLLFFPLPYSIVFIPAPSSLQEKTTTNMQGFESYLWQSVTLHSVPP